MSVAKPYYLLSQSQLFRFETWLQSILTVLAQRWWSDISQIKITATPCIAVNTFEEQSVRHIYRQNDNYLLVCGSDKQWLNAVGGWLGCDVDQTSALTKELESKYCKELVGSMSHAWHPDLGTSHFDVRKIISACSRAGNGGIEVKITINNFSHTVITAASAFPEIFLTKDNPANVELVNVASALHASTVTLEARLAAVQVPLINVSSLCIGSFIDLRHDLSGDVVLNGVSADISLKAELGKCGNNKAAQITSVNRK